MKSFLLKWISYPRFLLKWIFYPRFVFVFVFVFSTSFAQQQRRVYITLDVSGSMIGDKYALANYTTQMIATMCDDDDEVIFIVEGVDRKLSSGGKSGQSKISQIQFPISHFASKGAFDSQFNDIVHFNRIYKPSSNRQDWLFIVGDGEWNTNNSSYSNDRKKFKKIIEGGTLIPCYLQTCESLSDHTDFTEFVEDFGVVDIRKSSDETKTIIEGCNYFSKKILGFSDVNLKMKSSKGGKGIVITPELPISEFVIVYQDAVKTSNLPSISSASAAGQPLSIALKGTPSTEKLFDGQPISFNIFNYKGPNALLSGNVWRIHSSSPIPAGTEVELLFNSKVSLSKLAVYPLVDDIILSGFTLTASSATKEIDAHTSAICRSERKAEIVVEIGAQARKDIPQSLLKDFKVVVKANNKNYPAKYDGTNFVCEIDLKNNETQYYAEIDGPGYFHHTTSMMKIVKTNDCQKDRPKKQKVETKELPEIDLGSLTLRQLQNVDFVLSDADTKDILDPNKFDLGIELEHPFLYDDPVIRVDGDKIHVEVRTKKDICECLVPSELKAWIVATPKNGAVFDGDKQYQRIEAPIRADIIKENPFWKRCLWVFVVIGILLLGLIYLRAMKNKCRFKKSAIIKPCHLNEMGKKVSRSGYMLRKKGLLPWFSRWFLPFDEKRDVVSNKQPRASFTFVATKYKSRVQFPVAQFDKNTMRVTGYDPRAQKQQDKYVPLGDGGEIDIRLRNGMKDGALLFEAGRRDDEGAFITFLVILMLASILTIAFLTFMMTKGLFGSLLAWIIASVLTIILFWIFVLGKK